MSDMERSSDDEVSSDNEQSTEESAGEGTGNDETNSDTDSETSDRDDGTNGSEQDSDSSSAGENDSSDGEDSEDESEEKSLENKREDFEKMKELSVHMDNIVQRLSSYFPVADSDEEQEEQHTSPPVPQLPPLLPPDQPPRESRDTAVWARARTVDRAVSARRLTTDTAVSVASGRYFDEDSLDTRDSRPQNEEQTREDATSHEHDNVRRAPSGADRKWPAGGHRDTRSPRVHAAAAGFSQVSKGSRADVLSESFQNPRVNRQAGLEHQLERGGRSRLPTNNAPEGYDAQDSHEQRILWDELRESLAGVSDMEDVPGHGTVGRPFGGTGLRGRDIGGEEERRRLIEQAIEVLLEDSEEEELAVEQGAL